MTLAELTKKPRSNDTFVRRIMNHFGYWKDITLSDRCRYWHKHALRRARKYGSFEVMISFNLLLSMAKDHYVSTPVFGYNHTKYTLIGIFRNMGYEIRGETMVLKIDNPTSFRMLSLPPPSINVVGLSEAIRYSITCIGDEHITMYDDVIIAREPMMTIEQLCFAVTV